jgi:predicted transposase YbfD/YdcC
MDIVVIAILAVICGANSWVDVEQFGNAKKKWLGSFLSLKNGIPSHDTFGRVFSLLSPTAFGEAFMEWISSVAEVTDGEVIAIDGKALRRSFKEASSRAFIHLVGAWSTKNRVVLGQVKTDDKSNEITAIPKLLRLLDISGCIVTIDAMGCQKNIAAEIVDGGGDYVLQLKGNHPNLLAEVEAFFSDGIASDFESFGYDHVVTTDAAHNRDELRKLWCVDDVSWLVGREEWKGLSSLVCIESERQELGKEKSIERRYYLSSLSHPTATQMMEVTRGHWGIENSCHWVLDVAFREDDCRIRMGHGPENFGLLRRIALNLLKHESSLKIGIKAKRLRAGWDERYLLDVLGL